MLLSLSAKKRLPSSRASRAPMHVEENDDNQVEEPTHGTVEEPPTTTQGLPMRNEDSDAECAEEALEVPNPDCTEEETPEQVPEPESAEERPKVPFLMDNDAAQEAARRRVARLRKRKSLLRRKEERATKDKSNKQETNKSHPKKQAHQVEPVSDPAAVTAANGDSSNKQDTNKSHPKKQAHQVETSSAPAAVTATNGDSGAVTAAKDVCRTSVSKQAGTSPREASDARAGTPESNRETGSPVISTVTGDAVRCDANQQAKLAEPCHHPKQARGENDGSLVVPTLLTKEGGEMARHADTTTTAKAVPPKQAESRPATAARVVPVSTQADKPTVTATDNSAAGSDNATSDTDRGMVVDVPGGTSSEPVGTEAVQDISRAVNKDGKSAERPSKARRKHSLGDENPARTQTSVEGLRALLNGSAAERPLVPLAPRQEDSSKPGAKRKNVAWTAEENELVRQAVGRLGLDHDDNKKGWKAVSDLLPERTSAQVRERWMNHLDPSLKTEPWTESEIATLFRLQEDLGNQWIKIAKFFPGRGSESRIRNRWYTTLKSNEARAKELEKETAQTQENSTASHVSQSFSEKAETIPKARVDNAGTEADSPVMSAVTKNSGGEVSKSDTKQHAEATGSKKAESCPKHTTAGRAEGVSTDSLAATEKGESERHALCSGGPAARMENVVTPAVAAANRAVSTETATDDSRGNIERSSSEPQCDTTTVSGPSQAESQSLKRKARSHRFQEWIKRARTLSQDDKEKQTNDASEDSASEDSSSEDSASEASATEESTSDDFATEESATEDGESFYSHQQQQMDSSEAENGEVLTLTDTDDPGDEMAKEVVVSPKQALVDSSVSSPMVSADSADDDSAGEIERNEWDPQCMTTPLSGSKQAESKQKQALVENVGTQADIPVVSPVAAATCDTRGEISKSDAEQHADPTSERSKEAVSTSKQVRAENAGTRADSPAGSLGATAGRQGEGFSERIAGQKTVNVAMCQRDNESQDGQSSPISVVTETDASSCEVDGVGIAVDSKNKDEMGTIPHDEQSQKRDRCQIPVKDMSHAAADGSPHTGRDSPLLTMNDSSADGPEFSFDGEQANGVAGKLPVVNPEKVDHSKRARHSRSQGKRRKQGRKRKAQTSKGRKRKRSEAMSADKVSDEDDERIMAYKEASERARQRALVPEKDTRLWRVYYWLKEYDKMWDDGLDIKPPPVSTQGPCYNVRVNERVVSMKIAAGLHESALEYCHDVLKSWYSHAEKKIAERSQEGNECEIRLIREGIAHVWCLYRQAFLRIMRLSKESEKLGESKMTDIATSMLDVARSCPLVGSHYAVVEARLSLDFGQDDLLRTIFSDSWKGLSHDYQIGDIRGDPVKVKHDLFSAIEICNDAIGTLPRDRGSVLDSKESLQIDATANTACVRRVRESISDLARTIGAFRSSWPPSYRIIDATSARIICRDAKRFSRILEVVLKAGVAESVAEVSSSSDEDDGPWAGVDEAAEMLDCLESKARNEELLDDLDDLLAGTRGAEPDDISIESLVCVQEDVFEAHSACEEDVELETLATGMNGAIECFLSAEGGGGLEVTADPNLDLDLDAPRLVTPETDVAFDESFWQKTDAKTSELMASVAAEIDCLSESFNLAHELKIINDLQEDDDVSDILVDEFGQAGTSDWLVEDSSVAASNDQNDKVTNPFWGSRCLKVEYACKKCLFALFRSKRDRSRHMKKCRGRIVTPSCAASVSDICQNELPVRFHDSRGSDLDPSDEIVPRKRSHVSWHHSVDVNDGTMLKLKDDQSGGRVSVGKAREDGVDEGRPLVHNVSKSVALDSPDDHGPAGRRAQDVEYPSPSKKRKVSLHRSVGVNDGTKQARDMRLGVEHGCKYCAYAVFVTKRHLKIHEATYHPNEARDGPWRRTRSIDGAVSGSSADRTSNEEAACTQSANDISAISNVIFRPALGSEPPSPLDRSLNVEASPASHVSRSESSSGVDESRDSMELPVDANAVVEAKSSDHHESSTKEAGKDQPTDDVVPDSPSADNESQPTSSEAASDKARESSAKPSDTVGTIPSDSKARKGSNAGSVDTNIARRKPNAATTKAATPRPKAASTPNQSRHVEPSKTKKASDAEDIIHGGDGNKSSPDSITGEDAKVSSVGESSEGKEGSADSDPQPTLKEAAPSRTHAESPAKSSPRDNDDKDETIGSRENDAEKDSCDDDSMPMTAKEIADFTFQRARTGPCSQLRSHDVKSRLRSNSPKRRRVGGTTSR